MVSTCISFYFLSILLNDLRRLQSPLFTRFSLSPFYFWSTFPRSGHLAEIRWSVWILKSKRTLCVSFSWMGTGLCIYHLLEWSNLNFFHNSHWSPSPPSRVQSYTLFALICCIRLFNDWSFRLHHYITNTCYFFASNLFLLYSSLSLWRCFVLL